MLHDFAVRISHHPPTIQLQEKNYFTNMVYIALMRLAGYNAPGTDECHFTTSGVNTSS